MKKNTNLGISLITSINSRHKYTCKMNNFKNFRIIFYFNLNPDINDKK
jgi:hypothetical protein